MKVSRAWLQTYFEAPLPDAHELASLLTFHSFEVEGVGVEGDDAVLDIDVLANRSSDCLSHRGIARELSTILSVPMKHDPLRDALPTWEQTEYLVARVANHDAAPRHMAALVRGVIVGPSPTWLARALETIGQKSINNVVDATNYVMYNLGQPVHAFDFDKLEAADGARILEVTHAHEGEPITLLGGEMRTLRAQDLVIRDMVSGIALDIAGIKGGVAAELTTATTDIVIDCAHFDYISIRKTSRDLKVQTDASVRFQNEPSPLLPAFAMRDAIALITEIAGGQLVGVSDAFRMPPSHAPVTVRLTEIHGLLGTQMSIEDVERILVRFEWVFSRDAESFTITPPWERTDLATKEEVVEEVGRIYGYGRIAGVLPELPEDRPSLNPNVERSERVRRFLDERGYSEVYTYTLRDHGEVELMNPLAADKAFLRASLRDGLTDALDKNARNAPLLGLDTIKLFELGPVFRGDREVQALGLGVRAVRTTQASAEKELAETLTQLGDMLGVVLTAALEDGVVECALPFEETAQSVISNEPPLPWNVAARFSMWSLYPFSTRDIAVWVPETTPADEVRAVIVATASDLLVRHDLFDTFTKVGRTSVAYHLVFQASDRTLTDEEVGTEMSAIEEKMRERGWEVR